MIKGDIVFLVNVSMGSITEVKFNPHIATHFKYLANGCAHTSLADANKFLVYMESLRRANPMDLSGIASIVGTYRGGPSNEQPAGAVTDSQHCGPAGRDISTVTHWDWRKASQELNKQWGAQLASAYRYR